MAGQDIYGYKRNPKAYGVFSSEDSSLSIGDAGDVANGAPMLIQTWNVRYQQDVQELFEIGSNRLYWSKGRPQGSGEFQRVVGGTSPGGIMPKDSYDICDGGGTMIIKATGGHCKNGFNTKATFNKSLHLILDGVVITSIGYSESVQDVRIMEDISFRFAHMDRR